MISKTITYLNLVNSLICILQSLHWASVKKQPMLEHETAKDTVDSDTTNSCLSEQNTETHSYQIHQDIDPSSISHMSWSLRGMHIHCLIFWSKKSYPKTVKKKQQKLNQLFQLILN